MANYAITAQVCKQHNSERLRNRGTWPDGGPREKAACGPEDRNADEADEQARASRDAGRAAQSAMRGAAASATADRTEARQNCAARRFRSAVAASRSPHPFACTVMTARRVASEMPVRASWRQFQRRHSTWRESA